MHIEEAMFGAQGLRSCQDVAVASQASQWQLYYYEVLGLLHASCVTGLQCGGTHPRTHHWWNFSETIYGC